MNGEPQPQPRYGPMVDPAGSALTWYPAGSDRELIAALRHFLRETGRRPEELDARAGLHPEATAALLAGVVEPSGPLLRRLCHELRIPRWLFHLVGAVVAGAEVGHRDLELLVEKRRRQLAGNPDQLTDTDLTVEAVEVLLALGEDSGIAGGSGRGSRRGLVEGVKCLARRAERLGEPGAASLLSAVAAIVLLSLEDLAVTELRPVIDVLDMARSLEAGAEASAEANPKLSPRENRQW